MRLRPYQQTDLDPVIQLWWEAWHSSSGYRHPKPIEDWEQRWFNLEKTHRIVVIEDGDHNNNIIAFAALDLKCNILSQIFVSPAHKRQGIGKRLIDWALSNCPDGFSLKTATDNHEARAFYRALGMREGEVSINDFNDRAEIEYHSR